MELLILTTALGSTALLAIAAARGSLAATFYLLERISPASRQE